MSKERLLAYTDAVLAIIITIMVLEFNVPHGSDRSDLFALRYIFLAYLLSFSYLTIYRNNHHHMFQVIKKISSSTLWTNSLLLFFLSLIPFSSAWMAENHFAVNTVMVYGALLIVCAVCYFLIVQSLKSNEWFDSKFSKAIDKDRKGKWSIVVYIIGMLLTYFVSPFVGLICFFLVALGWIIPDRKMENALQDCKE